ncbi:MAG: gamma-glutamyl-gamma-aminobutyrate hydrolase family protein [Bacteroidetes bacterium]|nr:gamma-glutamyl-gamma-aminobutyrate hydrolase family protein [Bacteroidota bacterium]
MKKILLVALLGIAIPFLTSFSPDNGKFLKVALSKASPNYLNWIRKADSTILFVDLSSLKPQDALKELQSCSGLVLTGGGDIDPSLYMAGNRDDCKDVDHDRDVLEKTLIDNALTLKMPILGICRGEQMLNVFMGGSLITDIPSYMKITHPGKKTGIERDASAAETSIMADSESGQEEKVKEKAWTTVVHQCDDYIRCYHSVRLDPKSLLRSIVGCDTGMVTTNHHQAALSLGKDLKKNAQADDGVIEGIEWSDPKGRSFMLGVQWHPERMDLSNDFSGKILQRFVSEIKEYSLTVNKLK